MLEKYFRKVGSGCNGVPLLISLFKMYTDIINSLLHVYFTIWKSKIRGTEAENAVKNHY